MMAPWRQVKRRFEEHKSGSQKDETYDSACFDHEKTFNHKIDYENFKISDKAIQAIRWF